MRKPPNYTLEDSKFDGDKYFFYVHRDYWTLDELDEMLQALHFFVQDKIVVEMEKLGRHDVAKKIKEGKLERET